VIERRERRHRDGSAYVVYRVRWRDDGGKQRCQTFEGERDAKDFDAKLRIARRSDDLAALDAGRQTLQEFAAEWWRVEATPNLQRRTLQSYASHWNCHVLPRMGSVTLRRITPQTIARFRADLEADGVGDEAIRRTMAMLQGMLSRAVEWQLISNNPVKAVRKPRTKRKHAVQAVGPSAVEQLRAALVARGRAADAALVSVLAYAGLRPEEALALEWRHVRERTLLVEQKNVDGEIVRGQKTKRPPRTIALLTALRHDLLELRLAGGRPPADALVFTSGTDRPWREHDYRNWRRRQFQPLAPACGLSTRPYDLRHSYASLRIQEGQLSIVELAEQMGHSPSMTLGTYAHVIAEFRGVGRVDPDEVIQAARASIRSSTGDSRAPQELPTAHAPVGSEIGVSADPPSLRAIRDKPPSGFEPLTPSLRVLLLGEAVELPAATESRSVRLGPEFPPQSARLRDMNMTPVYVGEPAFRAQTGPIAAVRI